MFRIHITAVTEEAQPSFDLINRMKQSVRVITQRGVQYAQHAAPGDRLKKRIDYTLEDIPMGAVGNIWMPEKLKFTLPPGTKKHFIPGGKAVSNYADAVAIQKAKGYPLSFYWEREGRWATPWAVKHPGYGGNPWDVEFLTRLQPVIDQELEDLGNDIGAWYERK